METARSRPLLLLRCLVALAVAWAGAVLGAPPAHAALPEGLRPVPGPVVTGFDPPAQRWGPGHRGVDLAAAPGETVVAPAAGTVTFVGVVAGRPVVVVSHGEVRSTLEPVVGTVSVGTGVRAGDVVGRVTAGHPCPAPACVHWGLRRGEEYLDPLSLAGGSPVRLLPEAAATAVRQRAERRALAAAASVLAEALAGSGVLARPSDGRLTSGFGPRLHPIFRTWRLHAGVDLSEPCGRPIRAAADGVVTHRGFDASGGWRLVVTHPDAGGRRLETVYLHAEGYRVALGQRVRRGQVVGTVGSTGWSTGCHLHFGVRVDGRPVDPQGWW